MQELGSLSALKMLTLRKSCGICKGLLTKDKLQMLETFRLQDYEPPDSDLSKYVKAHIKNLPRLTTFETNFIY